MAPAYVANMAPPFLRYWKGWNRPISARWLGEHKTVMGFAAGVLAALVTTGLQSRIPWTGRPITYDDWLELGLRFGAGAMAGDSIKSFVKRRVGIAPGRPWLPWDQLDFVVGALALVAGRARLSWSDLAGGTYRRHASRILDRHQGCEVVGPHSRKAVMEWDADASRGLRSPFPSSSKASKSLRCAFGIPVAGWTCRRLLERQRGVSTRP